MRQIIVVSIVLAAVGGLVQTAFAEAMTCEQKHQKCLDSLPWGEPGAKCMRALAKCDYDARYKPDAITGAGPIVPGGGKPGKGGTKLTSSGNTTNNAGALAATSAAAKPAGVATSGAASGATTNNAKQTAGKPEAVPPQLAERLRRLQR